MQVNLVEGRSLNFFHEKGRTMTASIVVISNDWNYHDFDEN
jgi:hypothetical protein